MIRMPSFRASVLKVCLCSSQGCLVSTLCAFGAVRQGLPKSWENGSHPRKTANACAICFDRVAHVDEHLIHAAAHLGVPVPRTQGFRFIVHSFVYSKFTAVSLLFSNLQ